MEKQEINYAEPMVIQVENNSHSVEKVVLFGSNKFSNKKNYGNKSCIVVTEINGRNDYGALLEELKTKEFGGIKGRIQKWQNIQGHITKCIYSNFGSQRHYKDFNVAIMIDAYQQQGDIVDTYNSAEDLFKINADSHLTFKMKPKSVIVLSMYAVEVRLSGKNIAPVIIKTSKPLKLKNK